jgi:hypothetical protein
VPYGPQLVAGFKLRSEHLQVEVLEDRGTSGLLIAGFSFGGGAIAASAVAIGTHFAGNAAKDEYDGSTDVARLGELNRRIDTLDAATNIAIGTAVTFALTSGVLLLIEWLD